MLNNGNNNRISDSYRISFDQYDDMLAYLIDQDENNTLWLRRPAPSLRVHYLERGYDEDLYDYSSQAAIEDSFANTPLSLEFLDDDGKAVAVPVRNCAYDLLRGKAQLSGETLNRISKSLLAQWLSTAFSLQSGEKTILLLVRNEKVTAVHSGGKYDYAVLPMADLLMAVEDMLDERFPGYRFVHGYSDYIVTSAQFALSEQRDDLLERYERVLRAKEAEIGDMTPMLYFYTSDSARYTARISAAFIGGGKKIVIGQLAGVKHEGRASIGKFSERIQGVYAQYRDRLASLFALLDIYLAHPVGALNSVWEKSLKKSIPESIAKEHIAQYRDVIGRDPETAYDVFMQIQEMLDAYRKKCDDPHKILDAEETVAGLLAHSWRNYDVPLLEA